MSSTLKKMDLELKEMDLELKEMRPELKEMNYPGQSSRSIAPAFMPGNEYAKTEWALAQ